MLHLFQEDAGEQCHQKHQPNHPDARPIESVLSPYHLSHVDADEEDGHSAPKDFQMSYGLMDRGDILYEDAPHHHHHWQPMVDGMSFDEFHIGWGEEVEHHCGRDIPEVEFVMQPETPVDGNLSEEVDPSPDISTLETGDVEEAGDVEGILSWQTYMEKDDEEHRCSHQLTTKSTDVRQFYIFYLVSHK